MQNDVTEPDLTTWIGRRESVTDTLDLRPAVLMQSLLPTADRLDTGASLPPLWNWLYFHRPAPLDGLGRDGHPAKGGFLPPVALPRRMWAGGRFEFFGDLHLGETITRQSEILKVAPKAGRSGALCFVTVEHRYLRGADTVWREEHDIVYRDDPAPDQPAPPRVDPPQDHTAQRPVAPSAVMLFRYSALTFNGHRIHYDRDYARDVEGYPGLVFHGPLTATMLADFCRRSTGPRMTGFSYRAVSPLFDGDSFDLFLDQKADTSTAWATTPDGALAMRAEATFA